MAKEQKRCSEPPQHGRRYAQRRSAGRHPDLPIARRGSPSRLAQAATDRDRPRRKPFRRPRSAPKAGATREDGADVARGFAILVMKTRPGQRRRDRQRQQAPTTDKVGIKTRDERSEMGRITQDACNANNHGQVPAAISAAQRTSFTGKAGLFSNQKRTVENGAGRPCRFRAMRAVPGPCRGGLVTQHRAINYEWVFCEQHHRRQRGIHMRRGREGLVAFGRGHAPAIVGGKQDGGGTLLRRFRGGRRQLQPSRLIWAFSTAGLRGLAQRDGT